MFQFGLNYLVHSKIQFVSTKAINFLQNVGIPWLLNIVVTEPRGERQPSGRPGSKNCVNSNFQKVFFGQGLFNEISLLKGISANF